MMTRLILLLLAAGLATGLPSRRAAAYSYAASGQEPLLDGRAALFQAVAAGDWVAAEAALAGMRPDLAYLDANEDRGVLAAFSRAISDRDAGAVSAAFARAAADEIERRLNGARANFGNYQAAKGLVVTANRFFVAVEADLRPEAAAAVRAQMTRAIDALGNPGVFGVGARKPDPDGFDAAKAAILQALGKAP